MVLAIQRGGVCLFCTFRSAELRFIGPTTTNVKRQFSTGSVQSGILDDLLRPTRNPPSSTGNEQKDMLVIWAFNNGCFSNIYSGRSLGVKRKEGRGAIYDGSNPPRFAPANKARKREFVYPLSAFILGAF